MNKSGKKYLRIPYLIQGKYIDVYRVLEAFGVICSARAHAIKKLLCAGLRGKGNVLQDLREARDSCTSAIKLEKQRIKHGKS